jgi:alanine racemase
MRPTFIEINLPQIGKNIEAIRAHVAPAKVMPMVKANAYGHGVDGVAPYLEPYVDYFGVALLEEGIHLRELGIKKPILVAGGVLPEQIPAFIENELTLTASSVELLDSAEAAAESAKKKLSVHLKIDTGMERVGVHYYEAEPLLERSLKCKHVLIDGIYTHFANSKTPS